MRRPAPARPGPAGPAPHRPLRGLAQTAPHLAPAAAGGPREEHVGGVGGRGEGGERARSRKPLLFARPQFWGPGRPCAHAPTPTPHPAPPHTPTHECRALGDIGNLAINCQVSAAERQRAAQVREGDRPSPNSLFDSCGGKKGRLSRGGALSACCLTPPSLCPSLPPQLLKQGGVVTRRTAAAAGVVIDPKVSEWG